MAPWMALRLRQPQQGHTANLWRRITTYPPWLALEHFAVIFLILSHPAFGISNQIGILNQVRTSRVSNVIQRSDSDNKTKLPRKISPNRMEISEEGPVDVFSHEDVQEAHSPTMAVVPLDSVNVDGHSDVRGNIFAFELVGRGGDGVRVNLMMTKQGSMRSGDLHNCTQFDLVLKGRVKLQMKDLRTGIEREDTFEKGDFITIAPRVPHVFYFLEDNYMVEWWECDFHAWYFKPYRNMIEESFKNWKEQT